MEPLERGYVSRTGSLSYNTAEFSNEDITTVKFSKNHTETNQNQEIFSASSLASHLTDEDLCLIDELGSSIIGNGENETPTISSFVEVDDNSYLLRRDGETYALRNKKLEIQDFLADAELLNQKLKLEQAQIFENLENQKTTILEKLRETKSSIKNSYQLEYGNVNLKNKIQDLNEDIGKLRMELIEKIISANTAKRDLANAEVALEHLSNAYEIKRQEIKTLTFKVETAEKNVRDLRGRCEHFQTIAGAMFVK